MGGKLHQIHYTVFAVFDGHAGKLCSDWFMYPILTSNWSKTSILISDWSGAGCAVTASNDLWTNVQSRLESVATQLVSCDWSIVIILCSDWSILIILFSDWSIFQVGEEGSTKWFTR